MSLGRNVADGGTLIHGLVGNAIVAMHLEELEFWIEQPDSPNLLDALTYAPQPFVPLVKGMEGERYMIDSFFGPIREATFKSTPTAMTDAEVSRMIDRFLKGIDNLGDTGIPRWLERLGFLAMAVKMYPQARKALLADGIPEAELAKLPMSQVLAAYILLEYDHRFERILKLQHLPYWQAHGEIVKFESELRKQVDPLTNPGQLLVQLLLPAISKVYQSGARTDRRLAMLRCVEAVRRYAAEHDGRLPARLEEAFVGVPPLDVMTGKPFEYQVDGNKIRLTAHPPAEESRTQVTIRTYEITLRK